MNYDRLLQLGGIDREVPPVPGYITKEQLQGEIDGIKALIPDEASDDNQLADKNYVKDEISYEDVYIGVADTSSEVIDDAYHHDSLMIGRPVTFNNASGYIFVVLPEGQEPVVTMSSFEVTMTLDGTTTIGDVTYSIYKSSEQATGTFNISLF
jgi:hypothetical protein